MKYFAKGRDGKESITLSLVKPALYILMVKFAVAGIMGMPLMSAAEFGSAFAMIMAIWLGRETKEAYFKGKSDARESD